MRSKAFSEHTPINGTPKIHAILSPAKSVAVICRGIPEFRNLLKTLFFLAYGLLTRSI
jgi:hypothetical protein